MIDQSNKGRRSSEQDKPEQDEKNAGGVDQNEGEEQRAGEEGEAPPDFGDSFSKQTQRSPDSRSRSDKNTGG